MKRTLSTGKKWTAGVIISCIYATNAMGEESQKQHKNISSFSQADHGGVGLLQTPTSRMMDVGEITMGYKDNDDYRFWSVSLQLFPWMETTVRYTDFRNFLFSGDPSFSGDQTAKDKGVDFKFRLLEESKYVPQVAVGLRDFGGNGFFESEYITASKRFWDFDVHLGIGFGYLGNANTINNPLCEITDSFCERTEFGANGSREGGQVNFQNFFTGNTSIIGGIEYQSPWEPLRFKIEYEGNDYTDERANPLVQDSRWNFGLNYKYKNIDFSLSWERGNAFGFGINYALNFNSTNQIKVQPKPESLKGRNGTIPTEQVSPLALAGKVSENGLNVSNAIFTDDKYYIYGRRNRYRTNDEAIERIGRVIANRVPDSVETYHIVEKNFGVPMVETIIDAEEFIKVANHETLETDITKTWHRQEPSAEAVKNSEVPDSSGFFGDVNPFWIQTFGSPEAFYLYQAGFYATGGYAFNSNTRVVGSAKIIALENFDKFNFTVDSFESPVPRVRTLIREYVRRRWIMADTLFVNWVDKIGDNLYASAYGGYLETMYGGVGGELFYQEVDSNFGFGFDLNWVKQRSFENDFGFRDYDAFTGHFSVYWKPPFWKDVQLSANIGQFLAEDKGVNFEFARRFDSGVVVGAYAALTEISAEDYGEGSFTKGFYISIPFELFSLRPSKSRGRIPWVPIARDGGQPLQRPIQLSQIAGIKSPFVQ